LENVKIDKKCTYEVWWLQRWNATYNSARYVGWWKFLLPAYRRHRRRVSQCFFFASATQIFISRHVRPICRLVVANKLASVNSAF